MDKPPFMPVHTSHGHYCDTLANALVYRYKEENFVMRAVNRLDRNTSGLVLVAKNRRAAFILSNQMKNREIKKTYYALVEGKAPDEFSVEAFMKRKKESVIERCICSSDHMGAEYSLTEGRKIKDMSFSPLRNLEENSFSLLELVPQTGRTHQIRVHLSYMGFPIVGDELYGAKTVVDKEFEKAFINDEKYRPFIPNIKTESDTESCHLKSIEQFREFEKNEPLKKTDNFEKPDTLEKIDTFETRHLLHCGKLEFIHPETMKKISLESFPDFI